MSANTVKGGMGKTKWESDKDWMNDPDIDERKRLAPTPSDVEAMRKMWRDAGGEFHGPKIETATMPEDKLFTLLRQLDGYRADAERYRYARLNGNLHLDRGDVRATLPWEWDAAIDEARERQG